MDKLKELYVFISFALGACALVLSVYQGWQGKIASATVLGVSFLMCGLFLFLPQIKMFKVWEVQVELRETVDRAEELIKRLRRISSNSARSAYMQMAWGNRMASPSAKEKRAFLDEIDQQLVDLKLSPEERADIARPVVRIIGFDLYMIFSRTLEKYAEMRYSALVERARSEKPELVEARDRHSATYTTWHKREAGQNPFLRLDTYDLANELDRETPRSGEWMDERELTIMRNFAHTILALYKGCEAKGGYTPEAADFLDTYGSGAEGYERKAKELFGAVLNDLQ